jgi:cytoskeletal protein RodZ
MHRTRTRELNTKNVGRFLKNKRHKAKISIKDIANKIKTRTKYINYLENNDFQKLEENNVYVDGLIKNYIQILGLNINPKDLKDLLRDLEKNKKPFIELKKDMKPTKKMLRYSLLILAIIYLFFICLFAIQKRTFNIVYNNNIYIMC